MSRATCTATGLYCLRTFGTGTAIFWCEPDDTGDMAVFESEEQRRAGHKPLVRMSPQWFADILIEPIETERVS